MLGLAHTGGSILWVFSTVLLQRGVEDNFRGRVFAAELALLTLTMAISNYATGELLDRLGISARGGRRRDRSVFPNPGSCLVRNTEVVGQKAAHRRNTRAGKCNWQ